MLDLNSGNLSKEWTVDQMKLRHLMSNVWSGQREMYQHSLLYHAEDDGRRDKKLTIQSKMDLSKLPPCTDNLLPYIFLCRLLFGLLQKRQSVHLLVSQAL